MTSDNHTNSKKAYLVSLKHKLKQHLQLQSASANQVDRRWLNGFMAARFHSGLISLSELKLEYMKAHRNAYGERMTEAQEQQLERRLNLKKFSVQIHFSISSQYALGTNV